MNNSRRQLLQGLAFAPLPFLVPRARSVALPLNNGYPSPEFTLGDLVAMNWADNDEEDNLGSGTEFGKIVGMRWMPETKWHLATNPLSVKSWVYFVCWTHSTAGSESAYPHYDDDPYPACELRFVKHG